MRPGLCIIAGEPINLISTARYSLPDAVAVVKPGVSALVALTKERFLRWTLTLKLWLLENVRRRSAPPSLVLLVLLVLLLPAARERSEEAHPRSAGTTSTTSPTTTYY